MIQRMIRQFTSSAGGGGGRRRGGRPAGRGRHAGRGAAGGGTGAKIGSAVEKFFREQLQHRGRLVRVAAWALAIAVVLAPLPLVAAALEGDDPALDLSTSVTGKERKLVVGLAGRELDPDAVVTLRVERSGKTLAVATADAASDGKLKAAIAVLSVPAGSQLTVKASGAAGSPSRTQTVEVPQVVE